MPIVNETLELPGGGAPSNVTVTVTLAGESGRPLPAAYDLAGNTIVGSHQVAAVAGVWSVTLDRNDEIIPAGTAWKIVLSGPGVSTKPRFVSVVGAGPFDVEDILTDAPASIDPSTYALLDTRVDALETTTQPLDADLTTIAALDSATAGALATDGAGWVRKTYAQLKTALGLVKADVGLGNVDNTADSAKPVSTAQQTALDLKAPLASPTLTGTPTAPTAAQGTSTTQVATTAHVQGEAALLVPRSILTTEGDLFTRTGGVVTRTSRASLAADAAFATYPPNGPFVDQPQVGEWTRPSVTGVNTTSGTAVGQARWLPLWLPPGTYDGMYWEVTVPGSAGTFHRGVLYVADATGMPTTLGLDTGQVASDSAAVKSVTGVAAPLVLTTHSLVWGAIVPQGSAADATLQGAGLTGYQATHPTGLQFLNNLSLVRYTTGITGAPPTTVTASGGAANSIIYFGVHRSA